MSEQILRDLEIFQTNSGAVADSVMDAFPTKTVAGKEFMRNKLNDSLANLYEASKAPPKPSKHLLDWDTLAATESGIAQMYSDKTTDADKIEEFYSTVYVSGKLGFLNRFSWFMSTMLFYLRWMLPTISILIPLVLVIVLPLVFLSGWFSLDALPARYKDLVQSLFSDQLNMWTSSDNSELSWLTRAVYIAGTAFIYGSAAWTQIVASQKITHVCADIREQITQVCKYVKAAGYFAKELYDAIPELEFGMVEASTGQIATIFWRLRQNVDIIRNVVRRVGQADCETTLYNMIQARAVCRVKFSKSILKIRKSYHPTLKKCVHNDILMAAGKPVIITGPNKGGKSTILKSIGINLLFSHIFGVAFGKVAMVPRISRLETYINMYDTNGRHSLFESEVAKYRSFINQPPSHGISVLLVDEIFHSTNPTDGAIASEIVLDKLCSSTTLAIITTHYKELAKKGIAMCIESEKVADKLKYTYKLKNGVNEASSVFDVLETAGLTA